MFLIVPQKENLSDEVKVREKEKKTNKEAKLTDNHLLPSS